MKKTVLFDSYYVALGTSGGTEAHYGEYYASEEYELADDYLVTGKNAEELAGISRVNMANRPELTAIAGMAAKLSVSITDRYDNGLITPHDFIIEQQNAWTAALYDIKNVM